jgi:hypothetical protein
MSCRGRGGTTAPFGRGRGCRVPLLLSSGQGGSRALRSASTAPAIEYSGAYYCHALVPRGGLPMSHPRVSASTAQEQWHTLSATPPILWHTTSSRGRPQASDYDPANPRRPSASLILGLKQNGTSKKPLGAHEPLPARGEAWPVRQGGEAGGKPVGRNASPKVA